MELLRVILLWGSVVLIHSCQPWEFECQSSGKCLKDTSRCNKLVECTDGSDELRCPQDTPRWTEGPCLEGQFQCDNKHCVYKNWVCDHEDDCGDNSDETNCFHSSDSGGVLGVGAVVGISLACSGVLLLFLCTLAYMLYHRVKSVHGLSRRDPVQEITDIMGSVPYHMPREALLRLPPPQYTSRTNLTDSVQHVQENPGFIVDERQNPAMPPPLYTSQPDLAFTVNQAHVSDLPPAYSSRTDLEEVGQRSLSHEVSPPLEVYHHQHRRIMQRQNQNNRSHQNSISINTMPSSQQFQQRRFRGRVSRVRESLPVLNRLASFARRSLSRPRRSHRRSRGNRHTGSSGAMVEHFYCEKPRALRRQEESSQLTRQTGSQEATTNATDIQRNVHTSTGADSVISIESRDISSSTQSSPIKTIDMHPLNNDIQMEVQICSDVDIKNQDSIKDNTHTDLSFPLTLNSKCFSVPELTLLSTHQSSHVTSDARSCDLSHQSGNPARGQKSYSLTHLFDTSLKPLTKQESVHQSYMSVDSWNC